MELTWPLLEETMEKLSGLCDCHDREAFKRALKDALEKATKEGFN